MRIAGSSALVTGGASGLGEATVRELCVRGADVVIADIDRDRGNALASEVGGRFVATDVTRPDDLAQAVAAVRGPVRISVNCAGIGWSERLLSDEGLHDVEGFHRVLAVNLLGTFNALRLVAGAMAATSLTDADERGVVINTGSIASSDGRIGQIAYAASKAGVAGMTLPAARDLAGSGVRVCTIAPGLFETPMFAELAPHTRQAMAAQVQFPQRLGRPDEYAALACHIVENEMLNGVVIRLDGGVRLAAR